MGASNENAEPPSRLIDARIKGLADWRGNTFARGRALIHAAIALNFAGKKPKHS